MYLSLQPLQTYGECLNLSQDKSTWYNVITVRTDGGIIMIIIPAGSTTITDDMVHYSVGINNVANSAYPGKNGTWVPAYITSEDNKIVWKDKDGLATYNSVTQNEVNNKHYNNNSYSISNNIYDVYYKDNGATIGIKDKHGTVIKEFYNIASWTTSVSNAICYPRFRD